MSNIFILTLIIICLWQQIVAIYHILITVCANEIVIKINNEKEKIFLFVLINNFTLTLQMVVNQ